MEDIKTIKDLKALVGDHKYKAYGPLERFSEKADGIIRSGRQSEEHVIKAFKEMYHLCVAYLIGAEINNAPTHPVYEASEEFFHTPYDEWGTHERLGDIINKHDINYKYYLNKTVYESARKLFPFLDKNLLKENIEYLFPKKRKKE